MKKKKLNQKIIRVGDWVEIINPVFVTRYGYPLTFNDAYDFIKTNFINQIIEFQGQIINKIKKTSEPLDNELELISLLFSQNQNNKLTDKIIKAFAYEYLDIKHFGGKERKLYTEIMDKCKGEQVQVSRIKIVKTGVYYPPSGGYCSFDDDCCYEPGGLNNQQTHKLLEVCFCSYYPSKGIDTIFNGPCIEAINVKKIE